MRTLTPLEYWLLDRARKGKRDGRDVTGSEERVWDSLVQRGLATAEVFEACCEPRKERHLHLVPTAEGRLALRCADIVSRRLT